MSAARASLAPSSQERDSEGRLVGLAFDSMPAPKAHDVRAWLVAVDRSDNAQRAVACAAGLVADSRASALHMIHVQPWLSKEAAESELADRALAATQAARDLLDAQGLPWRLHVAMGEPAERVLEQATRLQAAGIIMGSRGLSAAEGLLFGSVAYKVMHLARVPVMVVP